MRRGGLNTFLFVDGYNVINAWGYLKEQSLEDARDLLIDRLVELAHLSNQEVIVVFDAYRNKKRAVAEETIRGITVVYTRENQTADAYIEGRVKKLAADIRYTVKVVTSDWVEQQVILAAGALRVTPSELAAEVERHQQRTRRKLITLENEQQKKSGIPETMRKSLEKWRNS